ncbi:hypothetical protein [Bradyrhizobium sp. BRP56]|uniref:hypothetical protein n=1 Tax=Bradyrhizobium sp. BRP56 TaxID=2793819 RepID=UPI001CD59DE6|nr:hypothetical protein [Bradyrhizobium sp. BRP56]MCA1396113.1 hypothetical protein [Bradyrhizobium sp. BRP56]
MSLVSLQADINDRQLENGARIVFEYQHPFGDRSNARFDPQLIASARSLDMEPEELFDLRRWFRRVTKESTQRLLREMAAVYTLNEPRDIVLKTEYLTMMQVSERYPIPGGDLLSLDDSYCGLLLSGRYIYVSEAAIADALNRYAPADLLNGMIEERCAT